MQYIEENPEDIVDKEWQLSGERYCLRNNMNIDEMFESGNLSGYSAEEIDKM